MKDSRIKATFITNDKGEPDYIEGNGKKHYRINLEVNNVPEDTYAVTYDFEESYINPIRESQSKNDGFKEELTSHGDYEIKVKVRSRKGTNVLFTSLADALSKSNEDEMSAAVQEATTELKKH